MKIPPFDLERYFVPIPFSAPHMLLGSDCEGLSLFEVLALADAGTRKLWDGLKLGYTEAMGLPLLRREIASLHAGISSDDILVIAPSEGIFLAMNVLLQPGDHVICTFPGYQSLYELAKSIGCEVELWEAEEDKGWAFDVQFLADRIRPNTKLVVCNFPHNPTGSLPSRSDYLSILEIASKRGAHVFSDEMYRLLELDPADRLPSACERYERAISLSGMSKTFGMAGVRIGWLVTRDRDLLQRMSAFRDYTTLCANAPGEILSLIALRVKEQVIAKHLARIRRNLGLLDAFFRRHAATMTWQRPRAGTIGFARLLSRDDSYTFCQEALKTAGVALLPSRVFGYGDRHVRIGFGKENLPGALEAFEGFLGRRLAAGA